MKEHEYEHEYNDMCNCLKIMDFMLYSYTIDNPHFIPFKDTKEMAEYFRAMLHMALPETHWYKGELP